MYGLSRIAASFNIYGFRFSIRGPANAVDGIIHDFAFFEDSTAAVQVTVELIDDDPPHDGLPTSDATVYTPRNVVYRSGNRRFIDYHGRAMGVVDGDNFKLYSRDMNLLYEAAYL